MTTAVPEKDPLETYESVPAVSFHAPNGGYAKGQWAQLEVRGWPELIQQRDDDGNPEFWDATRPGEEPQPKMVLVVPVYDGTDENGDKVEKNLWAKKMGRKWPDSLYQKLVAAQKKLKEDTGDKERRLRPGDILAVQYSEDDTSKPKVKGNYPKKYKAAIKPGTFTPPPPADALGESANEAGDDPWSTPQADAAEAATSAAPSQAGPARVGDDPFGPADAGDDEPPF